MDDSAQGNRNYRKVFKPSHLTNTSDVGSANSRDSVENTNNVVLGGGYGSANLNRKGNSSLNNSGYEPEKRVGVKRSIPNGNSYPTPDINRNRS